MGATAIRIGCKIVNCFNPRTRDGCDIFRYPPSCTDHRFNPRTRDGCDDSRDYIVSGFRVSIHAPVMGATVIGLYSYCMATVSIHAPVMGATPA